MDGGQRTSRAYQNEVKLENGDILKAVDFRHSFRDSLLVLLGMLGLAVLSVLVILRKRDSDPQ
jgi:hypothetical protein